jgi:MFS family permease
LLSLAKLTRVREREETGIGSIRAILADPGVGAVMALALLVNLGTGLVLPILPLYARSFGVGYGEAGLLVAAFYFARLAFDLVAGVIVDRLGIGSAAAIGLVALGLFAALTGLSPSYGLAVIGWAGAGAGAAVVWAAMYNGLIRFAGKSRMARAVGIFYGAFNTGIIAGGFLGGLLAGRFGSRAPLLVLSVVAVALVVFMKRNLPDPQPRPSPTRGEGVGSPARKGEGLRREGVLGLFRIPGFTAAVVSLWAHLWLYGAVFSTLVPLFAKDVLGISPFGIGILFAIALAAEFAAYAPAGSLADRRGRRFPLIPAFTVLAATCLVVGWSSSPVVLAILLAALGAGMGFAAVSPASMLADILPPNRSAMGVAIFRFGGDLGFSLGPLVCGVMAANYGFKAAFAVAGVPSLIALAVVSLGRETLVLPRTA